MSSETLSPMIIALRFYTFFLHKAVRPTPLAVTTNPDCPSPPSLLHY